jgi:hypothetical protein
MSLHTMQIIKMIKRLERLKNTVNKYMADIRPDRLTTCHSERKSVVSRRPSVLVCFCNRNCCREVGGILSNGKTVTKICMQILAYAYGTLVRADGIQTWLASYVPAFAKLCSYTIDTLNLAFVLILFLGYRTVWL